MTAITWSAIRPDGRSLVIRETGLAMARPGNGDIIAGNLLRGWAKDDDQSTWPGTNWDTIADEDEREAEAYVIIHEPTEIRGIYHVMLERQVVVELTEPAEPDTLADVLRWIEDETVRADVEALARAAAKVEP